MQVKDIMSQDPVYVKPTATAQEVARAMHRHNIGTVLVGENDKLQGVITDRDIALRVVAEGKDPATIIAEDIMTPQVLYCFEKDEVRDVAHNMEENHVLRLVVLNDEKRLRGIVAHSDIAAAAGDEDGVQKEAVLLACKHPA